MGPNDHKALGNRYYITILGTLGQQFSEQKADGGQLLATVLRHREAGSCEQKPLRRSALCDNKWSIVSQSKSHSLRKPLASTHAHSQRQRLLIFGLAFALGVAALLLLLLAGCGGGASTFVTPTPAPGAQLPPPIQASDVQNIVQAAVNSVNVDMVVAVVDRAGIVLGVFRTQNAPTLAVGNYGQMQNANDVAVALARTGAFFSNDQAPLSSRTVRYLSGIHLPPGVENQPNADLYGIENTNRGCILVPTAAYQSLLPPATALAGGPGLGVLTGKADVYDSDPNAVNPAGVPIFDQPAGGTSIVLGGVGVVTSSSNLNVAEFAAFTASLTQRANSQEFFGLKSIPPPGAVFIGGIQLPFVNQTAMPSGFTSGPVAGTGAYVAGFSPISSLGQPPEGDLITPTNGPLGGLTAAQVTQILDQAEATAMTTRAAIRLPLGSHAEMVIAVADLDGTFIGLRRMPDATIFSVDVAASKARNMTYFNSGTRTTADLPGVPIGTAVTNRTISFGAMPLYPPGIGGNPPPGDPGPFFNLFLQDTASPCTQGAQTGAPNVNKSGIVFFPGSAGLFINGQLVGALGVSGDGVDQDDFVTSGGTAGFEAPTAIRADQIFDQGVRLPYFKFPRNPTIP